MTRRTIGGASGRSTATLSAQQRRLRTLLHRHGIELRNVFGCDIREEIDVDALRTALAWLLGRHDVLRSYYPRPSDPAAAPQVVAPRDAPALDVVTLESASPDEQRRELANLQAGLQTAPMSLDERPYVRLILLKLAGAHWHLMGAVPAINADGRSVSHLIGELEAAYRAKRPPALVAPAPQFHDVAAWMNGVTDAAADTSGQTFWRRYLAEVPWRMQVPVERAAAGAGFHLAVVPWDLPRSIAEGVSDRGAGGAPWLKTRLVAAAAAWLSRLCDRRSVYVGVTFAGRCYDELQHAVGPFDRCVPIAVDIDERTTFRDLDLRVQQRLGELRDWQEWFDVELADGRGGGPPEIAYPICVEVRHESDRSQGGTFTLTNLRSAEDTYGFKLTCTLVDGTLRGEMAYNAAVYTPATVRRVQQQLDAILDNDGAGDRVSGTQRLSAVELKCLLAPPLAPMPEIGDTIHQLFERQAAAAPDAVAIVEDEHHLSYAALNGIANRLAHRLRTRCPVGPEALVAVQMTTSLDVTVAILATLKTGSAFVPLDPDWPVRRLDTVLRTAGVAAVVTRSHGSAPVAGRIPHIECDGAELWSSGALPVANPGIPVGSANLAYVLYTSGTSGAPKGAMISHGGLTNYLTWCADAYGMTTGRGAVVHSPVTFDFTLTCLLGPLAVGGCVHVCRTDRPLEALARVLSGVDEVSAIKLTPSSVDPLRRLLAEHHTTCSIGRIVIGGEALSGSPQLWSFAHSCGARIVNEYGPTECVVGSTVYVTGPHEPVEGPIPIGGPIANTRVQLLRADGQPAATWMEGEIHIGGYGVARGYLNSPALTAASFIPQAYGGRPGERLYRTGDLARTLSSGDIVYLSRRDSQVKIRGYRIELLEVEQEIRAHPGVADCVVTVADRPGSHPHLVAFMVPGDRTALDAAEIRDRLSAVLPAYMVPSAIHVVPALPVTAHGKVDVHALQTVVEGAGRAGDDIVAPRSEVERALHRLWRDVLQRERIGIDDNFFELGGDSILSIQFLARAHDMGLRLRPSDMEAHPTIRELAAVAGRAIREAAPADEPRTGDVPLAPMQRRFFEWNFAVPRHYNHSVLLAVPASWTAAHVARAVRAVVEHHDALRLAFDLSGDVPRQSYGDLQSTRDIVTAIDGSTMTDEEVQARLRTAASEAQRSIQLHAAPLLNAVVCSRGPGKPAFVYVVVHHLVMDHVSWTILLDDLRRAVEQAVAGEPIALPPPTAPYAAWTRHISDRTRRGDLGRERAYWLGERWKSVPALRVDHPDRLAQNVVADEESVSGSLGSGDTHALVHDTAKAYNTRVVDLLVTAYALAYANWSGALVQSLDLEGHGRESADDGPGIARTIGWFTALYPVYLRLTRPGDIRTSIQEVKEALRAVPANGAGYGLLRYFASDEDGEACRALHRAGVAFNYLGQVEQAISQDSPIAWVPSLPAGNRSAGNARTHLLDVGVHISGGELRATFTYGRRIHERSSIAALAHAFIRQLTSIVAHCASQRTRRYTPSDFPLAGLDQSGVDDIVTAHPDVEDVYPLSDMQKGMLFHATHQATATTYVVQLAAVLSGRLDQHRFEESWRQVIARHSALRTSFVWTSVPEPLQIVHRRAEPVFEREDWRTGSDPVEARLDRWLLARRTEGLDLTKAPLHRFALLRLGEQRYQFVWLYHHILVDGWSTINVLRDVLAFYAEASGKATAPHQPAAPFRDYIAWLQSRRREDSRQYWQRTMAGVECGTVLAVPRAMRAADAAPRVHADELRSLGAIDSDALIGLARRLQLTPNVLVQGAWALVLSRYARTDEVVFGVTVSGRPHDLPDVEHRVGLFLNTLPMRVAIDRRATIGAYLKGVNAQLRSLVEHGHMPLVEVQRLTQVPESEPLFESIVVFENFPAGVGIDVLRGELEVEALWSIERNNYPLTVVVGSSEEAVSIKALYDPGAFAPTVIRQVLEHLVETLRWMTRAEDSPLGSVAAAWSRRSEIEPDPRADPNPAPAQPVHALFEQQAARAPEAIAVVDPAGSVSYDALNRRANQLARHLVGRGVRPGTYVAVCLERSAGLVAALLATLKAGAAYVPVDARFPSARIQLIAGTAQAVITDAACRHHFDEGDARVVDVDRDASVIDGPSTGNLTGLVTPSGQAAYLMYTSGSSGQPKGTIVTHENVTRLLCTTSALYECRADDVWSFFHSIAFDFSVWEIFGALLSGGRLVVVPYWTTRSPEQLAALVRREQVTVLSQTPSAFQQLVTIGELTAPDHPPHGLRRVVFGGEALHAAPLRSAFADLHRRGVQIVNMYGITETTVHVTHRPMDDFLHLDGRSPVGRALPHLRVHLVDDDLWPVPEAVAGEICVAGDGLAIGYAESPRLTAERFVPSPFGGDVGKRLYRSGDLGRALGGGDLEYLGRGDTQVKVRGFRIEPDEIRTYLLRQPSVRDALVRVEEDPSGDRVLVAYVIPAIGDLVEADLSAGLRQQLPEHMVPAAVKIIDRFPLTPNGKIDYESLARIPGNTHRAGFIPPQTWEQEVIAGAWCDALGASEIGVRDNFFTAGGDSIKALRVIAGLRARGFVVTIEQLFQHPTISELARAIASESGGRSELAAPSAEAVQELHRLSALLPPDAVDLYPATQLQLGMLYHAADPRATDRLFHNVTLLTLQGSFDEARFRRAVDRVIASHPALRTALELRGHAEPLQIVYRHAAAPVTVARLEGRAAADQRAYLDEWFAGEKRNVFACHVAPLIRFHVAVCGDDLFHLGVTEHHAILDGWSVASLLAELFQLYRTPDRDVRRVSYSPGANTCRDYVLLERTALASEEHRTFWSDYLSDYVPLPLPVRLGDAGAECPPAEIRKRQVTLDPALTKGLRRLASDAHAPLKSVLLAAHVAVMSYISNSADTVTGVITHGRPETEGGETALGLFLNTLPLRMRVADTSWMQWIRAVREEERRVLPYRRYPLAAMRDRLGRPVSLTTAFNYTHFHVYDRLEQDAGISVRGVVVDAATNFTLLTDFSLLSRTAALGLTISYDASALGDTQIEGVIEHYLRCLALMVDDPEARMSACAFVADERRRGSARAEQALESGTWADLTGIMGTAEQSTCRDRIAVVDGDRHLCYGELWARVRAMAERLCAAGVAAERPVAVLMDKSLEWVVSALAILRAGGVYAPVDIGDPAERVSYILGHIGAAVAVTDARGSQLLGGAAGAEIRGDRLLAGERPLPMAPPALPRVLPENLAYVLYTSGSTGKPKGVAMHHGGLAHLMNAQRRELPLADQRILQYASPAFDVSIQEIFTVLSATGTLLIVPSAMRRDFVSLACVVAEEQVQCVFAPDTAIRSLMLAAEATGRELRSLSTVVNAGEPLMVDTALARFVAAGGELHNHYGPTETHVVTTARIGGGVETPSIGREIDHTDVFILDRWLRLVPPGTIGEMHIASPNVARGYYRAPRLTAERFVPTPYGTPGERAFRTGDLGHRTRGGEIVFKGRSDTQVKLRGYRIELDEVRHAILRDARITDAAVALVEHNGDKRLRAYVVAGEPIDAEAVRASVAGIVPQYMVPSSVVQVPVMPITRNGKVDYAALSAAAPATSHAAARERPTGAVATPLFELWRDVLGPAAGVEPGEDFLDSGGDSILLLKLQLRIHARFGVTIPLSTLGLHSTLERMSRSIEDALAGRATVGA